MDGIPSVQEIVDLAESRRLPAIALTDTNALYGAMEFISGCRKAGIAPIIGAELALAGGHSIVLLAQSLQGYSGLCQLITRLQAAPDREASLAHGLSMADLAQHTEGLIALSGGRSGPLDACLRDPRLHGDGTAQAESVAQELVNLFGQDRFFIELQIVEEGDAEKAAALQSLADRLHLRTVATHDIHYLAPADAPHYQVLTAMRKGRHLKDLAQLADLSYPLED